MENFLPFVFLCIILFISFRVYRHGAVKKREKLIANYRFPARLTAKLKEKYPHLTEQESDKVILGLREYFQLCNIAGRRMVSMPSQAVDVVWHEFILFTKEYQRFCKSALGFFLHHTPAEAMKSPTSAQKGIKTAWKISCFREKIEPRKANRLPLLFAIDADLSIEDGFKYSLDCSKKASHPYCANGIGCGSGCGGCSGSGCGGCGGD